VPGWCRGGGGDGVVLPLPGCQVRTLEPPLELQIVVWSHPSGAGCVFPESRSCQRLFVPLSMDRAPLLMMPLLLCGKQLTALNHLPHATVRRSNGLRTGQGWGLLDDTHGSLIGSAGSKLDFNNGNKSFKCQALVTRLRVCVFGNCILIQGTYMHVYIYLHKVDTFCLPVVGLPLLLCA